MQRTSCELCYPHHWDISSGLKNQVSTSMSMRPQPDFVEACLIATFCDMPLGSRSLDVENYLAI